MNVQERLRQLIDEQQGRLRAGVPLDREAVIRALLRALARLPRAPGIEPLPDLFTGHRLVALGGNKALQLCLESTSEDAKAPSTPSSDAPDGWADRFLQECGEVARVEQVLMHCETGFMRIVEDGNGTFDAWIATRRSPTSWRERGDFDWWASWLARHHEPELRDLRSERSDMERGDPGDGASWRRLADVHLKMMANQLGYPPDAVIGGCTVQTFRDVLAVLIGWALEARDGGEAPAVRSERELVVALASELDVDPAVVGQVVTAFTVDRENAAYHAAVPGVAAAPLVRVGRNQLVLSVHGLTTEPLLFLTRELKRRAAEEYHNTAYLREDVFRQDLYALFQDKRFVTSSGRVELRRESGNIRTDIDAVVFDRKTGTLGLFELKSQDPFARSTAELAGQRDNVLYANRQVSAVLDWLKRHGADELLGRVDFRTARRFRVQKVYPFVLGRYLAHFSDGPAPDRRAAWGTWPQVLRQLDGQAFRAAEGNPLTSLSTRLTKYVLLNRPIAEVDQAREVDLGAARITVHPTYAAYQASGSSTAKRTPTIFSDDRRSTDDVAN